MQNKEAPKKVLKLSASRLATFQKCSWLYWCKYGLKLPDKGNVGADQGTVCHAVFEHLIIQKHRKLYDKVVEAGTVTVSKGLTKYIRLYMKKLNLPEESFDKINVMVLVGLKADFLCKGAEVLPPELEFTIENENPPFVIMGLIDKLAKYKNKWIRIIDYKSSKKKYQGDDADANPQAMMYMLAAKKLWPELTPVVDFMFLQFPEDPKIRCPYKEDQIEGFKHYVGDIYKQILNFSEKEGKTNLAKNQDYPGPGEFKGPLLCGRAKFPGQLKKDGTVMWHCPFKFKFEYFALCNEEDEVIKTAFTQEALKPNFDKGEYVIPKRYGGCPAHNRY
jgi:hypothetical protein